MAYLSEKGLAAAKLAWTGDSRLGLYPEQEAALIAAIRAYLSAVALHDELEVVAWHWEGRARDYAFPVWAWQKERPATAPENAVALADFDQAHSIIAALRAERDRWKSEAADHFIALQYSPDHAEVATLEAEVKRLTEDNEALRAAPREDQEPALEHIETLTELLKVIKEHWIDYDHVFSIAVHEAEMFMGAQTPPAPERSKEGEAVATLHVRTIGDFRSLDLELVEAGIKANIENMPDGSYSLYAAPAPVPVTITPEMVGGAMQEAWDEICSDTAHHPLDIEHGKGNVLYFSPRHWADLTAMHLTAALSAKPGEQG